MTILSSRYQETHKLFTDRDVSLIRSIPEEIPMVQEIFRSHGYTTLAVTGGGFTSSSIGFSRGFDKFRENAGFDQLLELVEEKSNDGRPIFAFLHTYEIHAPYDPPERYRELFGHFDSQFDPTARNLLDVRSEASTLAPEDLELIRARYDGGIRFTDDLLRELFSELESTGFLSNAIVVVTSDHGKSSANTAVCCTRLGNCTMNCFGCP